MMQLSSELSGNKYSLINVMHRFIAAANKMDETIMVPSLLMDVPVEEHECLSRVVINNNNNEGDGSGFGNKQRDMYEHYLLLKSLRNDMEWGLLRRDLGDGFGSSRSGGVCGSSHFLDHTGKQQQQETPSVMVEETMDLEGQFHYHLHGLFGILAKLTIQADHVTNCYKREIGVGDFIR